MKKKDVKLRSENLKLLTRETNIVSKRNESDIEIFRLLKFLSQI